MQGVREASVAGAMDELCAANYSSDPSMEDASDGSQPQAGEDAMPQVEDGAAAAAAAAQSSRASESGGDDGGGEDPRPQEAADDAAAEPSPKKPRRGERSDGAGSAEGSQWWAQPQRERVGDARAGASEASSLRTCE